MSNIKEKYLDNEFNYDNPISRTEKNYRLYKEVYSKYENEDNLPLEDNVAEIDLERLKELVLNSNETNEHQNIKESLNILDTRKRKIDEQKIYDINKILEKAKNDNSKLKETTIRETIVNKNILSTLESKEISLAEIREASIKYEKEKQLEEQQEEQVEEISSSFEKLSMTREFKFKELSDKVEKFNSNPLVEQVMPDNDLSLDLFEELKPTGNTIVTKPIKDEQLIEVETDMHSSDTRDIDIIKPAVSGSKVDEFFTNSYEFSKKDFASLDDEEKQETTKDNSALKIILLIIAILIFTGAIAYFILNFGIGL